MKSDEKDKAAAREFMEKLSAHKTIPSKYREPILKALSYYPELKYTRIVFRLVNKHPVPYGTIPSFASFFKPAAYRVYYISLLEQANAPEDAALFRNLSPEAQVAVIGHELAHVIQFSKCSVADLMRMAMLYPFGFFKKKLERAADIGAIEHGVGVGLYRHAVYLRSIPGYVEKRPEINKYYLKPKEIMERIIQRRVKMRLLKD